MLKVCKAESIKRRDWGLLKTRTSILIELATTETCLNVSLVARSIIGNLEFSEIKDILLRKLPPNKIRNCRGRTTAHDNSKESQTEELFYLKGTLFVPPISPDGLPIELEKQKKLEFTYTLTTNFESFSNNGDVYYRLIEDSSSNITSLLTQQPATNFLELFPGKIDEFRLGLEFFKQNFFGSLIGSIPAIDQRYILEINNKSIYINIDILTSKLNQQNVEHFLASLKNSLSEIGLLDDKQLGSLRFNDICR